MTRLTPLVEDAEDRHSTDSTNPVVPVGTPGQKPEDVFNSFYSHR